MDLRTKLRELFIKNPETPKIVELIRELAKRLEGEVVKVMDFCGTHEWTITSYGLRSLMPENVELVAGPGCPVCVTPGHYVEGLVKLSLEGINIFTYGDSFKLPSIKGAKPRSLAEAKMLGGKVTVVYSFLDAIKEANKRRNEEHVFFAVGFETTMPAVAEPVYGKLIPNNLTILSAYRLTPPIMKYLLENVREVRIDGVIAPGHVSAVIGYNVWEFLVRDYSIPTVVSGFEPVDVLLAILAILKCKVEGKPALINEYSRVVKPEGSLRAKKIINEVFETTDSYWRGIGVVPSSGALLKDRFRDHDASLRYRIKEKTDFSDVLPGCRCGEVTLGKVKPISCPLFMKSCTPENPYGPCMVSSEGTCKIWAENLHMLLTEL
ncbi:MAG: hydrogenase formation protein HypD [Desulfurococcaceae archaeon TW002]